MDIYNSGFNPMDSLNRDLQRQQEKWNEMTRAVQEAKQAEIQRDIEKTEYLKQIMDYNSILVDKNNNMQNLLEDILNSIGANSQRNEQQQREMNKLLEEFKELMSSSKPEKENNLKEFLKKLTGDIASTLIAEYFKMQIFPNSK